MASELDDPLEQAKKKSKTVNRLRDMIVSDVDIVDRAANGRQFLLFKREATMPNEQVEEIVSVEVSDADVESGNDPDPANKDAGSTASDEGVAPKEEAVAKNEEETEKAKKKPEDGKGQLTCKDEQGAETEKQMKMPAPVKESVSSALREATERMMSLITVLRSAKATDDKTSSPLPDVIHKEIKVISTVLGKLLQRYPAPSTKSEGEEGEEKQNVEKKADAHSAILAEKIAALGTLVAEINATDTGAADFQAKLDQMSSIIWSVREFATVVNVAKSEGDEAAVGSGASGDEGVREFLKAAGNVSIPSPVRDAVMEKIRSGMERLLSVLREVRDMETTDEKMAKPVPDKVMAATKAVMTDLNSITEKYPSPMAKIGNTMAKLEAHLEGLRAIISDVMAFKGSGDSSDAADVEAGIQKAMYTCPKCGATAEGKPNIDMTCPKCSTAMVMKSDVDKAADDRITNVEKKLDDLIELAKPQKKETTKPLPSPNSADTDAGTGVVKKNEAFRWPGDIAEKVRKSMAAGK